MFLQVLPLLLALPEAPDPRQPPSSPRASPLPASSPSHPAGPLSEPLQAGLTVARALPAVAAVTTASVQGRNHLMPGGQWPRHRPSSPGDVRVSGSGPRLAAHREHQPCSSHRPGGFYESEI